MQQPQPAAGVPAIAIWARSRGAADGQETKLLVPQDGHVADILHSAAQHMRFGGRAAVAGELCATTASGEHLANRREISTLVPDEVLTIHIRDEPGAAEAQGAVDTGATLLRAGSWPGPAQDSSPAPPSALQDMPGRAQTWIPVRDDTGASGDPEAAAPKPATEEHSSGGGGMPDRGQSWPGPGHTIEGSDDGDDDGELGGGMPSRRQAETWVGVMHDDGLASPEGGSPPQSPQSQGGRPKARRPPAPPAGAMPAAAPSDTPPPLSAVDTHTPQRGTSPLATANLGGSWGGPAGAGPGRRIDTTGDGIRDSVVLDTTGDGIGDTLVQLPPHLIDMPATPGSTGEQTTHPPSVADTQLAGAVPPAWRPARPPVGGMSHAVYIDRIPVDVSDQMLVYALDEQLPPQQTQKVASIEVIRNQMTRHCHAFAFLTQPPPAGMYQITVDHRHGRFVAFPAGQSDLQIDRKEEVRVQISGKENREASQSPSPKRTVHFRIYARRNDWASNVVRMHWAGLLALLEIAAPRITQMITMVADDRSRKNMRVHRSVVLCAFFVECETVENAIQLRDAVHDMRVCLFGVNFLFHCDYTMTEKKLHDTCRKRDTAALTDQFAGARALAIATLSSASGDYRRICRSPEFFEFGPLGAHGQQDGGHGDHGPPPPQYHPHREPPQWRQARGPPGGYVRGGYDFHPGGGGGMMPFDQHPGMFGDQYGPQYGPGMDMFAGGGLGAGLPGAGGGIGGGMGAGFSAADTQSVLDAMSAAVAYASGRGGPAPLMPHGPVGFGGGAAFGGGGAPSRQGGGPVLNFDQLQQPGQRGYGDMWSPTSRVAQQLGFGNMYPAVRLPPGGASG